MWHVRLVKCLENKIHVLVFMILMIGDYVYHDTFKHLSIV